MEFLAEYDFDIAYLPGKENIITDTLSRYDGPTLQVNASQVNTIMEVSSDLCQCICKALHNEETLGIPGNTKLQDNDGLLYYKDHMYIPLALWVLLLKDHHDSPLAGH